MGVTEDCFRSGVSLDGKCIRMESEKRRDRGRPKTGLTGGNSVKTWTDGGQLHISGKYSLHIHNLKKCPGYVYLQQQILVGDSKKTRLRLSASSMWDKQGRQSSQQYSCEGVPVRNKAAQKMVNKFRNWICQYLKWHGGKKCFPCHTLNENNVHLKIFKKIHAI